MKVCQATTLITAGKQILIPRNYYNLMKYYILNAFYFLTHPHNTYCYCLYCSEKFSVMHRVVSGSVLCCQLKLLGYSYLRAENWRQARGVVREKMLPLYTPQVYSKQQHENKAKETRLKGK